MAWKRYEGFYISGLENKNKYESTKIALLFFKIFPIKVYTLLHAFEPIVETLLPLWLGYLQKICILNASTSSEGAEKRWLSFYFLRTAIKRSHSMPSQDYTADDSLNRYFECSKMQLFEPMCESSHCRVEELSEFGGWFSSFIGRPLTNKCLCSNQNWLFKVVLVVRLRHVQFFRKNRRSFAWKCFVR